MYARRHRSDTLQFVNGAPVAGQPVLAAPFVGALAPKMAARAGGSISNVGSEAGHIGLPGGAAYSATKGALASMARLGPPSSAPLAAGAVPNVYTAIQPDAETEAQAATAPMSRVAQPDEIAEVITFLASPKASYFTGAIVAADGGRTAI